MFWKCKGRLILFNGRGYRKENKIPVVFPYRKLKVSSLGNFSFKRLKLKFLHDETKVSHRWNYGFCTAKPKVPMHETIGFAVWNSYFMGKSGSGNDWMLFNKSTFPSLISLRINSPNSVFCRVDLVQVKLSELFLFFSLKHQFYFYREMVRGRAGLISFCLLYTSPSPRD